MQEIRSMKTFNLMNTPFLKSFKKSKKSVELIKNQLKFQALWRRFKSSIICKLMNTSLVSPIFLVYKSVW